MKDELLERAKVLIERLYKISASPETCAAADKWLEEYRERTG